MSDGLLDNVRRAYEKREKLGDIWAWADAAKGLGDKAKRFNAAARFAGNRKEQADKPDERTRWLHAQEEYREKREKLLKRIEEAHAPEAVDWDLGPEAWGGMRDFFEEMVYPLARKHGVTFDQDDKEYGHAVGGDHDPNVRNAFAEDLQGGSMTAFVNELAQKLGGSTGTGTFGFIYVSWRGKRVRVQILWQVADHYDHGHVGGRTV